MIPITVDPLLIAVYLLPDYSSVLVGIIDLPEFWEGLFTAILGVLFWIIGLVILYVIYERYLKDKDQPDRPDDAE